MKNQELQRRAVEYINRFKAEYDESAAQLIRELCFEIERLENESESSNNTN